MTNCSGFRFKRTAIAIAATVRRISLTWIRALGLQRDVFRARFNVDLHARPKLFNLDAHISVIADLRSGAQRLGIDITSWSISGSNGVFRRYLNVPDPVRIVNSSTWTGLDESMINEFSKIYGSFLKTFDGFVVTYPPAFAQLFSPYDRPTLVVAATRYEWPYSLDAKKRDDFEDFLRKGSDSEKLLIAANNKGDADYLQFYTGLKPKYVPSLCDYTRQEWDGNIHDCLILARSEKLTRHVNQLTGGRWIDFKSKLGKNYEWSELASGKAVFIVPYNISVMSLFELATMGVPVIVPSQKLMKELRMEFEGVLSEVSFIEMNSVVTNEMSEFDPNNYLASGYIDWWLERADFYNTELMPNVAVIDSLDELLDLRTLFQRYRGHKYNDQIDARNQTLFSQREYLLQDFMKMI
jgi:hypothetical protein